MAILNMKKSSNTRLAANFVASEFKCKGSGCCTSTIVDEKLVSYLQQIREHFGKPLIITSAYRCATHNRNVGGASNSYHTRGMAADFYISGISPLDIAKYAEAIGIKGVGYYDAKNGNFVHIDTRSVKTLWLGHAQTPTKTFQDTAPITVKAKPCYFGCTGDNVRAVQVLLGVAADGIFGANTLSAVETFQRGHNIPVNGIVDAATLCALIGGVKE